MAEEPTEDDTATRRTSPVELLWDLVFAFAVTQVTTLLRDDLSWAGRGTLAARAGAGVVGLVGVRLGDERARPGRRRASAACC